MSGISDIADGVISLLNEGTFSSSFTAKRVAVPLFERETLRSLTVTLWIVSETERVISREHTERLYTVDVGIQNPADPDSVSDIDSMMTLIEEVRDTVRGTTIGSAVHAGTEAEPLYNLQTIGDSREFISVISITYREVK
jgi:hypothetical protein